MDPKDRWPPVGAAKGAPTAQTTVVDPERAEGDWDPSSEQWATQPPSPSPEPTAQDNAPEFDLRETAADPRIPAAHAYFKIGEVAKIVGVKPYVLRYWEEEFSWVRPEKTSSRQRRYRRKDVALLLKIKRLRHDEQLTIAQARALIQEERRASKGSTARTKRIGSQIPLGLPQSLRSVMDQRNLERRLADVRAQVLELMAIVED